MRVQKALDYMTHTPKDKTEFCALRIVFDWWSSHFLLRGLNQSYLHLFHLSRKPRQSKAHTHTHTHTHTRTHTHTHQKVALVADHMLQRWQSWKTEASRTWIQFGWSRSAGASTGGIHVGLCVWRHVRVTTTSFYAATHSCIHEILYFDPTLWIRSVNSLCLRR